jgi:hypothetical protein
MMKIAKENAMEGVIAYQLGLNFFLIHKNLEQIHTIRQGEKTIYPNNNFQTESFQSEEELWH